jgi:hypothetical protein
MGMLVLVLGALTKIPLCALGGRNVTDVAKTQAAKALRVAGKAKALAILAAVGEIEEGVGSGIGLSNDFDRIIVLVLVLVIVAVAIVVVATIGDWFGRHERHDGSRNRRLEIVVPVVLDWGAGDRSLSDLAIL